ncbi:MAG TPA: hypothetical protein VGD59_15650 [Acidisarcina sp.]
MRRGIGGGIKFALFVLVAWPLFGLVIEHLWNWLTPGLFGWHLITFWQAVGLFLLSRLLFGGFHHGGGGGHRGKWKRRMWERWEKMTPEEREKFRGSMRGCGSKGFGAAPEPQS